MANLSVYLSPFAPDYSGVSSVLFDLHTVTAMHDASGCTGNYTGYDEPRWYGSKSGIFCSGLREIDAILGDDEKLIRKMIAAANDLEPELLAVVGSPVPMVIGSDLAGIAAELEARTGIPSLGFDTTGTAYYDKGAAMASIALLKKFTKKSETISKTVNILGATPLDFSLGENLEDLKMLLKERGYQITTCLSMGYTMEDLKKAGSAQVNLAVSKTGFLIAEYMEKNYGIPYLCGLPIGKIEGYFQNLQEVAEQKISKILNASSCEAENAKILIVGEQVQSNAIRLALEAKYGKQNMVVGCLFGKEKKLALPQDQSLSSEALIKKELNKSSYRIIIADPFLKQLVGKDKEVVFYENAQYAVSSKVEVEKTRRLIGEHFYRWFEK